MKLSIVAGATSQSINIFIQDSSSTTGAGLSGLVFNTSSLIAYYSFTGANATSVQITLATLAAVTTAYSSGGFKEIDATNMKGWYRLDLPNAAITTGKGRVVSLHLGGATNMAPCPVEIELTGWDNQDSVHGGMSSLPNVASGSAGAIPTTGTGSNQISVTSGQVIIQSGTGTGQLNFTSGIVNCNNVQWLGGTIPAVNVTGVPLIDAKYLLGTIFSTPATAGIIDVNVKNMNNVAATSITTINANQGTTQPLNFTGTAGSALVKSDMVDIAGSAVSATSAQIGVNVVNWNNTVVATPATAGIPDINVKNINNISSSSVATISANQGTTQPVNFTGTAGSALIKSDMIDIASAAVSTSSAQIGINVVNWGTTAVGAIPPDVVFIRSGTAQAGGASTITLDSGASATNNLYQNQIVFIRSGTGAGQSAIITSYVGSTKVATIVGTWATNPDVTSVFSIMPFGSITTTVSGGVNVTQWNGTNVATPATAGIPEVNIKNINNVSTSSVATINANQGTTQPLNFTGTGASALAKSDMVDIAGSAVSATVAQIGVNVVNWNNTVVATPATAGIPDINIKNINNISASSVTTINANQGTTQPLNFTGASTSALVKSDMIDIASSAVSATSAQIGVNVVNWTNVTAPSLVNGWIPSVTVIRSGTAQAGGASTITLDSGASATNNLYNNELIYISGGTGVGQVNTVSSYVGSTKVATMISAWATNPDATSTFIVLPAGPISATVSGGVNVTQWNGSAVAAPNVAGVPIVDLKYTLGTISPAAAGSVSVDWAHVVNPTSTVSLSGTTVGTVTTTTTATNLTNLPSIPANWITAAGINAGALNGKGDWLLASSAPTNFGALGITVAGKISEVVLTDTLTTYTGNTPQTGDAFAIVNSGTFGNSVIHTQATNINSTVNLISSNIGTPAGISLSADVAAVKASVGSPQQVGTKYAVTLLSSDVTGNIASDLQTIKTQAVTCAAGVTVGSFVGSAHALAVDGVGLVTFNNTSIGTLINPVVVQVNNDKTGYSLTQAFPTNFASLGISAAGKINEVILCDTITTYTGDTPQTGDSFARIGANGAGLTALAQASTALTFSSAVPTTGNTINSVADCLNAARAQGFGPWKIIGTTLNLYASDGVTIVHSFTLDSATNPTQRT